MKTKTKNAEITKAWLRGGAGPMRDRRLRKQKTRAAQKRSAMREQG